jgi:hypothetical protein
MITQQCKRLTRPDARITTILMSLTHDQLNPGPILTDNQAWVYSRKITFVLSLVFAGLDIVIWSTCEDIGPIRRTIFWSSLLVPLFLALYSGYRAISQLDRAITHIQRIERGCINLDGFRLK